MNEIIAAFVGAVAGAFLACVFSIIQRSYEEWRSFQQQISIIQDRFVCITFESRPIIEPIRKIYDESLQDVAAAIFRVRPYLLSAQRVRLTNLLEKYRQAHKSFESGLIGRSPMPGGAPMPPCQSFLPSPEEAKPYLIGILEEMLTVGF